MQFFPPVRRRRATVRVRLSVEKDGNVLSNWVYEILTTFDIERASRDVLQRAIRTQSNQNLKLMAPEEMFDLLWGAAIRIERP
jgi:hypothetical protein